MSSDKSKKTFCSLYTFVKTWNEPLYEILEDMCAIGLFRPRFPTTYLNPSEKLVKKLTNMVNNGESENAFHELQKLFIHGKHTNLKGELVTNGRNVIKSDLSSLKQDSRYKHWDSRDKSIVYVYDLDEFPTVGKETVPIPKEKKGKGDVDGSWFGSNNNKKVEITKELMQPTGDLQKKVAWKLNSLLKFVRKEDLNKYNQIIDIMDPNLILSWYFVVKPNMQNNPYVPNDLFNKWSENKIEINETDVISEIFKKSNNDSKALADAKDARSHLSEDGFDNLLTGIQTAYKKYYPNNNVKILEDELRFRYSNETELDNNVINELNSVNWDQPESSLVLIRKPVQGCLYKPSLFKLMKEFVNSSAFLYVLFNSSLYSKFKERLTEIGGAGNKKMINLLGSNNRDLIGSYESSDPNQVFTNFVGGLDAAQKALLKSLL